MQKPLLEVIKFVISMVLTADGDIKKLPSPRYMLEQFELLFYSIDSRRRQAVIDYLEYWEYDLNKLIKERNGMIGYYIKSI